MRKRILGHTRQEISSSLSSEANNLKTFVIHRYEHATIRLKLGKSYIKSEQDKILRRKRLSTGAKFVHVYLEIWDTGILKYNKFSM